MGRCVIVGSLGTNLGPTQIIQVSLNSFLRSDRYVRFVGLAIRSQIIINEDINFFMIYEKFAILIFICIILIK